MFLEAEYDLLCGALPMPVVQAAELCALPHFVDDQLACKILHDFAKLNGTARMIWAETKSLPFVYPYERGRWRFVEEARAYFSSRLEKSDGDFLGLHQYLADELEIQREQLGNANTATARELEWQIAYHLVPLHPEKAVDRLIAFGENTAQSNQLADVKGVIDLFEEQDRWLSGYQVERSYFEGRYAYAKKNYPVAEARFKFVWERGKPNLVKAISGHLWGRILKSRGGRSRQEEAERLYRESLKILRSIENHRGVAMVLNSLGGVLVDLGGRSRQEEAERLYRESLNIERSTGNHRGVAMVLNSLGGVLVDLGGRSRQEEAECLYRESLKIGKELGLERHEAMVLNSLGGVLVDLGGRSRQEEAERLYLESLKIGKELGLQRHIAMVLFRLARLAEALGEFVQAQRYVEEVNSINKKLGNSRFIDQNLRWLDKLRKLSGQDS